MPYVLNPFTGKLDAVLDSNLYLRKANNLSDVADVATARTNLGLVAGGTGDIWVEKAGDTMTGALELQNTLVLADTTSSITGVVYKGANGFLHNFHHPTGNTQIPAGLNTFIGIQAGNFTMGSTATQTYHGSYNTGIGYQALSSVTTGFYNVGVGYIALKDLTTGASNVGLGHNALRKITEGNYNFGMGTNSLWNLTTGSDNVGIGASTLRSITTTGSNVAIGSGALYQLTGAGNVGIGYLAGYNSTGAASYNVFLGYNAGYTESGSNKLYIENTSSVTPLIYGEFNNDLLIFNGKITVNGMADVVQCIIQGNATQTNNLFVIESSAGTDYFVITGGGDIKTDSVTDTNVWLGVNAGNDGIGTDNIGIGYNALTSVAAGGVSNLCIGSNAGTAITTGDNNVALGKDALKTLTVALGAIAIGTNALSLSNANYNIAIGTNTLQSSTGVSNVAIGYNALSSVTTGTSNLAIGVSALAACTASNNLAIGFQAADVLVDGTLNTVFGTNALGACVSGSGNVAIGYQALTASTASNNLAIGRDASHTNTSGTANAAIGYFALYDNSTGNYNIAIGYESGKTCLGSSNVFIGYQSGYSETGSNTLYIANSNTATPLIYGVFPNTSLIFNSATVRVTGDLWVGNNADIDPAIVFDGATNDGQITWMEDENYFTLSDGLVISTGDLGITGTRVTKGWFTNLEVTNDITIGGTALATIYSPIAGSASIVTVGTIATGTWEATDVAIAHGGTGQSTAQAAIDALTAVSAATAEHVLTKDTATGNAIWKVAAAGGGTEVLQMVIFDFGDPLVTGDGKFYVHIPSSIDGMDLTKVHAEVITAGTTNTTDIQIYNVTDSVDMLSTKLTIDSGETGSDTAATPAVIDTTHDDVVENDLLRIDMDAVSTTPPEGLIVTLEFE